MIGLLDVVVAEHLGLDQQALAQIARGTPHRIEALDHREDLGRVLRVELRPPPRARRA
jgi:hypothetical protein